MPPRNPQQRMRLFYRYFTDEEPRQRNLPRPGELLPTQGSAAAGGPGTSDVSLGPAFNTALGASETH